MRRYGESVQHEKAKYRIASILRENGWITYVDNHPFECQTAKGPRTYWPDVYAENYCIINNGSPLDNTGKGQQLQSGGKRIIVEIQGKGGHNTKLAFNNDNLRVQDIRQSFGRDIEHYEVRLKNRKSPNDIRNWSDADILQELGISA